MLFFGHLGPAAFAARRLGLPVLATMFFTFLPDLIDKPLFLLGLAPYARYWAHTLLFLFGVTLLLLLLRNTRLAFSAFAGIGLHLFLDLRHLVPLFMPFAQYSFPTPDTYPSAIDSITIFAEAIGLILFVDAYASMQAEASELTSGGRKATNVP